MSERGQVVLIRHGATMWSENGRHTGESDLPLLPKGEAAASALRDRVAGRTFGLVLISPLRRAARTAELAGLTGQTDRNCMEWRYGAYEGRTTAQIREDLNDPDWTIWFARIPAGTSRAEQPEDVAVRCRGVLDRIRPIVEGGQDAAIVAHGHFLRILTATWLGLPAADGRLFALSAGSLSTLGYEHETPVITSWNT